MTLSVGFTRPRKRIAETAESIRARGWEPVGAPSLEVIHGDKLTYDMARNVLASGSAYFTVFGSITAVEECMKEWGDALPGLLRLTEVACTGPRTAEHLLKGVGRTTDVIPETYTGIGVAETIAGEVKDKTVLLLRSGSGDMRMVGILEKAGAAVLDVATYDLVPSEVGSEMNDLMDRILNGNLDAMLFSSPLSASSFMDGLRAKAGVGKADAAMERVFKVAIGGPTAEGMREIGIEPNALPENSTFDGMLDAVFDAIGERDERKPDHRSARIGA